MFAKQYSGSYEYDNNKIILYQIEMQLIKIRLFPIYIMASKA